MVVLTGKNLGQRHCNLNQQVAEFVAQKKNFNDIKTKEEVSDVDKLYKIDIASRYKDIEYIVDILRSGDSLYISRALKCSWLYHDDCSYVFNTENLHANIFPFMSIKMKKKMLSTISMYIQNGDRAAQFFLYCKENKMPNIAFKFLNISTEELKLNVLSNVSDNDKIQNFLIQTNLQHFVGNSFVLATKCVETCYDWKRSDIIYDLRYLYGVNNEKYLDLMEKYELDEDKPTALKRLGIRTSKDIILKHKNRLQNHTLFYVNKLSKTMLAKYISQSDTKQYLSSLMPKSAKIFWKINLCRTYDYILNVIPINERYEILRHLFTTSYPEEAFEMSYNFYSLQYYNMMSIDQREEWALRHIEEQKEILGEGNDYIWYEFVNIDKALEGIKKYIMITPDRQTRTKYICVLVKAAKSNEDLKKVLYYYYERHVNEKEDDKCCFIDKVLCVHNVFEFDEECWKALDKLFRSLGIYDVGRYVDKSYVAVAIICHILHNIDMPEALMNFIDQDVNYIYFKNSFEKLGKEKTDLVLQYLINLFLVKLKPFEQDPSNKKLRKNLRKFVNNIVNLVSYFGKSDEERPEIVKRFLEIDSPKCQEIKTVTTKDLFSFLKTDATSVIVELENSDVNITDDRSLFKTILRKLKVYFHDDVSQAFIKFLNRSIEKSTEDYSSQRLITSAIFGIFHLSDERYKVSFMEKYHPLQPKIDHGTIDRKLLYIQEAICRCVGYSRPPVPLRNVLRYIQGDYVHFCIPMFNMYLVNLPLPLAVKFTESLLDAPISIQKHGLRLAFHCFNTEGLKTLLSNAWKKSKNVSLRLIIYKSLFDKITELSSDGDVENAKILYEALKIFTSDLNQDDHEDLFVLVTSTCHHRHLSDIFIDDYFQTAWHVIFKLPRKQLNINRQTKMIESIDNKISLVNRDFVRKNIIDEHNNDIFVKGQLRPDESLDLQALWNSKLNLIANFIIRYNNSKEIEDCLALVNEMLKRIVEKWNDKYKEMFIFQKLYLSFIKFIEDKINDALRENPKDSRSIPIVKHVLDILQEAMPSKEIYLIVWRLKLTLFFGISLNEINSELSEGDGHPKGELLSDRIVLHVTQFIQELLTKKQFYPVYLSEISILLRDKLLNWPVKMEDFDMYFIRSLTNVSVKETQLLALMILPKDPSEEMKEMHTEILKKIQTFEDEETQSYLHFKFLSNYDEMFNNNIFS